MTRARAQREAKRRWPNGGDIWRGDGCRDGFRRQSFGGKKGRYYVGQAGRNVWLFTVRGRSDASWQAAFGDADRRAKESGT